MPFAFWFLVALSHIPLLSIHFSWMWKQEAYHYLPALGLAIVLLYAIRWDRVLRMPVSRSSWGLMLISSCVLLPLAVWSYSPWLTALSFIISVGAFLLSQRSASEPLAHGTLLSLWPLAWLVLPLPMASDQALTAVLQLRSSRLSSYFLDLLHIPHVLLGNVIELSTGRLFVEEACSGVQSLYTLIFCAVLIVVVLGRAMALLPLYVGLAVVWAGLMNVIRIVTIAAAKEWYKLDWSHGWQHRAIGYVSLAIAVLLLLSSDRVIRVFFFPTMPEDEDVKYTNPIVTGWNYLFWNGLRPVAPKVSSRLPSYRFAVPGLLALAACLFVLQSVSVASRLGVKSQVAQGTIDRFWPTPAKIPNTAVENFVQIDHETVRGSIDMPMGANADIWRGSIAASPVAIALNQPYPTWHDLAICYQAVGWQLNDRKTLSEADLNGDEWDYTFTRWITDRGNYAYLWYCAFDERGQYVDIADRSLLSRWRDRLSRGSRVSHGQIAIVQMVVESESALPPDVMSMMDGAFLASRRFLISTSQALSEN